MFSLTAPRAIAAVTSLLFAASITLGAASLGCGSSAASTGAATGTEDAGVDPGGQDAATGGSGDANAPSDGGASGSTDAGAAQATRVIVKPNGQGDGEVVSAIRSATRTVRLYVYLLTDDDVVNALVDRARAGVDVKVLMNRNFPVADALDPQVVFDRLTAGRVKVAWAPSAFLYTHAKTLVVDDRVAWIMTMNMTVAGSTTNREFLVEDKEAAHVTLAAMIFDADYANRSFSPPDALVVSPQNAKRLLAELAGGATRTIDVEGETFSDDTITAALVAAKRRGVTVRVVVAKDRTPTTAAAQATAALKGAQIPIVSFGAEAGAGSVSVPYVHAKSMVVDGDRAYVGSANFTTNAFENNREIGVVVRNATAVGLVARTIDADFRAGSRL